MRNPFRKCREDEAYNCGYRDGHYSADENRIKAEMRAYELESLARDILGQFAHHGHPGRPCMQTGWVPIERIQRWRQTLENNRPDLSRYWGK